MGNYTSCFSIKPQAAILIDTHADVRQVKVPITAAEIMLDKPGHVLTPALQIRRTGRITALKAEEELSAGKVYLLVPASRTHCKVSSSEMALVDSACEKRRRRRYSSKILPAMTEGSGDADESPLPDLQGNCTGLPGHRLRNPRQWIPVLEPISEGI